ncbi:MAG: hypothetical protein D6675_01270 [Gemmatimonadetes bacterium]|nr:MAG: hypothetical protein D6675_01270 [Gemmatimonadota bacterium]
MMTTWLKYTWFILPLLIAGCAQTVTRVDDLQPAGYLSDERLNESSGLIKSRQYDNVFWTHNDSGDTTQLFAITAEGQTIRHYFVQNARNVDWEDIALDEENNLYLADVGNNRQTRTDLKIYKIPEPNPTDPTSVARATEMVMVTYPDGNFDCEGIFWRQGQLYLITKAWEGETQLYRLPQWMNGTQQTLERIGKLNIKGLVTATDYSPANHLLAVLAYRTLWIYTDDIFENPEVEPLHTIVLALKQNEAICWDGDVLRVTNEQRDMYEIPPSIWQEQTEWLPPRPEIELPRLKSVQLDGKLTEWTSTYQLPLDTYAEVDLPDAHLYAGWQPAGLYIAAEVPVDSMQFAPRDQFYQGDCLMLMLDIQNEKKQWFTPDTYHFWFAFDDSTHQPYAGRWKHDGDQQEASRFNLPEIEVAGTTGANRYQLEAFIPANVLGQEQFSPSTAFGGNVQIWVPSTGAEYTWGYSTKEYYSFDKPYLWGTIRLKK